MRERDLDKKIFQRYMFLRKIKIRRERKREIERERERQKARNHS